MNSTKDHSHGTNVLNFEALITLCQSLGTRYNPKKDKLKLTYMQTRLSPTKELMRDLDKAQLADTDARAIRRVLFEKLATKVARVMALFSLCDLTDEQLKSAKSLVKKIQGRRLTAPKKAETEEGDNSGTTEVVQHEANQQSFMFLVQHFQKLIEAVSLASDYDPNELDLKVNALEHYLIELKGANSDTIATGTALDRARNNRDRALYREDDGLVKIAKEVKKYINAVFGTGSDPSNEAYALLFVDNKFVELEEVVPDPA